MEDVGVQVAMAQFPTGGYMLLNGTAISEALAGMEDLGFNFTGEVEDLYIQSVGAHPQWQ